MQAATLSVVSGMAEISPARWDALGSADDPFTTWAFLSALEESGSCGPGTGWLPLHLLVHADERLVAACPLYVKEHSYGEYIFDWGWARAARQAGLAYYPKLVSAVPFTPATGPRLLVHPDGHAPALRRLLLTGIRQVAEQIGARSAHVLFSTEAEWTQARELPWLVRRVTHQYHWINAGYADWSDWTGRFRSRRRKEAARERAMPGRLGAEVVVARGEELTDEQWRALEAFYRDTVGKKWGHAYLTPEFFQIARQQLAPQIVGLMARAEGRWVAGALAFQRGRHLYGRYWGCLPGFEPLHFELCYHRPIEMCIDAGWTRFEAGAQGQHKVKRGLLPAPTYSLHWLRHGGLHRAVEEATAEERAAAQAQMAELARGAPFRRAREEGGG